MCYKVVVRSTTRDLAENEFVSAVMDDPRFQRVYVPGKWTYPNHARAPLFAFSNIDDAVSFVYVILPDTFIRPAYIFSCEVMDPRPARYMPDIPGFIGDLCLNTIMNRWKRILSQGEPVDCLRYARTPDGTVYVSAIKLIDLVWDHQGYK